MMALDESGEAQRFCVRLLARVLCHPGGRGGLDARLGASLDPRRRDHCSVPRVSTVEF